MDVFLKFNKARRENLYSSSGIMILIRKYPMQVRGRHSALKQDILQVKLPEESHASLMVSPND